MRVFKRLQPAPGPWLFRHGATYHVTKYSPEHVMPLTKPTRAAVRAHLSGSTQIADTRSDLYVFQACEPIESHRI
jgi:hypothetical protein